MSVICSLAGRWCYILTVWSTQNVNMFWLDQWRECTSLSPALKGLNAAVSCSCVLYRPCFASRLCAVCSRSACVARRKAPSLKRVPEAVLSSVWWQNHASLLLICTADPRWTAVLPSIKRFLQNTTFILIQGALTRLPNLFPTNLNLSPSNCLPLCCLLFWENIDRSLKNFSVNTSEKVHNRVRYKPTF